MVWGQTKRFVVSLMHTTRNVFTLRATNVISGVNGEVMPNQWQWELHVGPVESIGVGDQVWVA